MNQTLRKLINISASAVAMFLGLSMPAHAAIDGISGPVFNLKAASGYIGTADGNSVYAWGYAEAASTQDMQFPGPTLIVNQGDTVTVNLSNNLPVPVSIIFPGQNNVVATSGSAGLITQEAAAGGTVSYTFVAAEPGTYTYHSGTQQAFQVEMGLVGALIVRPAAADPLHQAYAHASTAFNHEYLFLLSEMDPSIHARVEKQVLAGSATINTDTSNYVATLWFINGRTGPDTMLNAQVSWLPNQPYNSLPRMHPGEKLLMRVVSAGRDLHPFHTHGNNHLLIARDGRMLQSAPGAGPDLAMSNYTLQAIPGETYDAMFEWTGKNLNFDIYGHNAADPMEPFENAADHGKPFPRVGANTLTLPNMLDRTDGDGYSGSPFLGQSEAAAPGKLSINQFGGYFHMWHSHTERELVNDDIFPGGMMTMLIIEPHGVTIP